MRVSLVLLLIGAVVLHGYRIKSNYRKSRQSSKLNFGVHEVHEYDMLMSNAQVVPPILQQAFNNGIAGLQAGALQVVTLMWLRTAINYQYRYGKTTTEALNELYKEGGIARLYQGLPFALLQGPLSRFGDTAANSLISTLTITYDANHQFTFISTLFASLLAGCWRIGLMPIDTVKTSLQVNGASGWDIVKDRINTKGITTLYSGALAASAATIVGHYPWFLTYNYLSEWLLTPTELVSMAASSDPSASTSQLVIFIAGLDSRTITLLRSAFIGLTASSISDICSNSLRVLKTTRQTDKELVSYVDSVKAIVEKEGLGGLLGRGLQTRLLCNSLQGVLFSVLYKSFQQSTR